MSIRRDYTAHYLDELAQTVGTSGRWITVHGQRALLQDISGQGAPGSAEDYVLTWTETGTTLTLTSSDVSSADLTRTANGLAVGRLTQPKDRAAATTQATRVLQTVFDGKSNDAKVMAGIVNGTQLAPALTSYAQTHPQQRASARIIVKSVIVIDADNAVATATLPAANLPANIPRVDAVLSLQRIDGSWQLPQQTYCNALGVLRPPNCPPG